jgi:hypothetical protein
MPMHDWTRDSEGVYPSLHNRWMASICNALNAGLLPPHLVAIEQKSAGGLVPDVLTLERADEPADPESELPGSRAVMSRPARSYRVEQTAENPLSRRLTAVVRRVADRRAVAAFEVVSPGNKGSRDALSAFRRKVLEYLERGVHVAFVDPFPPNRRAPSGLHAAIWPELAGVPADEWPAPGSLVAASYRAGPVVQAFAEPFFPGEPIPDMPLYIGPDECVMLPLEASYMTAFLSIDKYFRRPFESA